MSHREKLLAQAINNPYNLHFKDLQTLLKHESWILDHQTGSHQIWYSPKGCRLSLQNKKGKAKAYQVKQFLQQREKEINHA